MTASPMWRHVFDELEAQGIQARAVPVGRVDEVRMRVDKAMSEAGFASDADARIAADFATGLPEAPHHARSVVIAAVARPLTQANLTWHSERRAIPVPPHYAGYETVPRAIAQRVDELLRPAGFSATHHEPPLKTLAACVGLARYGRNNVTYVPGLGSWLQLAACVSDAPPPADTEWGAPQLLERCERCSACLRACPTEAIRGDRFVLHTDRCLTWHNESREPFPDWLDSPAHHCAVGCLRCQQACPENARVELVQAAPEWFDEAETAAILAAEEADDEWAALGAATREKLVRCGLDYAPRVIARNIRVLLGA